ncbi:type II toxin-antitoxin system VapC family toxin [Leptothoe sp. LEGE 181152]|uniref:Ribonuclease VapC n=1 Tax=Adonisia turfae CCMR0081 TaxID=2292702 RepID=A0A6M0RID6_9CYAN|nr:type II toxin-antitoxin system VapC family toxin [Adonisia turfae]MDV3353629.1 type II toxin-antitoxin system VapC family toxin [Leptothoe sp. LEGE 181152]NEZ55974.1 type II toxin-antitoxin system VapC family toxin [Adonisia turfae CCMR0081]
MHYLLDTNVCVVYLNGRSTKVRDRLLATPLNEMAVCSVVKAELFYGAMRSNNPTETVKRQQEFLQQFVSLPFGDEAAKAFGRIRAQLASVGTPIGAYDLQIAAIAMVNGLTLVTHNTREFDRVEGLRLEDWELGV